MPAVCAVNVIGHSMRQTQLRNLLLYVRHLNPYFKQTRRASRFKRKHKSDTGRPPSGPSHHPDVASTLSQHPVVT